MIKHEAFQSEVVWVDQKAVPIFTDTIDHPNSVERAMQRKGKEEQEKIRRDGSPDSLENKSVSLVYVCKKCAEINISVAESMASASVCSCSRTVDLRSYDLKSVIS